MMEQSRLILGRAYTNRQWLHEFARWFFVRPCAFAMRKWASRRLPKGKQT